MSIARQLFRLQELDAIIEQQEASLTAKLSALGNRTALEAARSRLTDAQKHLDGLKRRRKEAEWEVDDLLRKIASAEEQLYSGRITNPKELSNLQQDVLQLKSLSDRAQDRALEIIEQLEAEEKAVASASDHYRHLEEEWQRQQQQLNTEINQLRASLKDLREKRQQTASQLDTASLSLYEKTRQQKKTAVAKVEQGICGVCRISLSASTLQKARSGQAVLCSTCGRILYLP